MSDGGCFFCMLTWTSPQLTLTQLMATRLPRVFEGKVCSFSWCHQVFLITNISRLITQCMSVPGSHWLYMRLKLQRLFRSSVRQWKKMFLKILIILDNSLISVIFNVSFADCNLPNIGNCCFICHIWWFLLNVRSNLNKSLWALGNCDEHFSHFFGILQTKHLI